ncbi:ImmA/IrrE family metallo-endopeptidase [Variovorax sp. RB3P1]|uniref:ImmA/IrrE family metallo-endopeptidase n=1 Tax=Variovorax sp. RB3P1 TaxID=3443732 RepID=UPI003F48F1BC
MTQTLSPAREAIKMAQLWRAVHGLAFPINAGALAQEWSMNVVPEAPIGELQARELKGFEGGLFWLKERKVWALLYHPHPDLPGRSNFTVAHEFGHYVLHRKLQEAFQCSQSATLGIIGAKIEREADQFASYLLMPIDDYTQQVRGRRITLDLLGECADRYGVSLTAAILKWLEFTDQPAVAVMGREGMLHWWKASGSAKKHTFGVLQEGMELPSSSLAVNPDQVFSTADYRLGVDHPVGVWPISLPVREMIVLSDRYDMSISLIVLDAPGVEHPDAPDEDMTTNLPSF